MDGLIAGKKYVTKRNLTAFTWENDDFTIREGETIKFIQVSDECYLFEILTGNYCGYEVTMEKDFTMEDLEEVE